MNPNEIIPTPANGLLHDLTWGVKKIVDADAAGEESWETIFEGEVTTAKEAEEAPFAQGSLDVVPSADSIKVTFNGEGFTVNKQDYDGQTYYGEVDAEGTPTFNTYPFFIASGVDGMLFTPEAGTYSLKIEAPGQSGDDSDFSIAQVSILSNTQTGVFIPIAFGIEGSGSGMIAGRLPVDAGGGETSSYPTTFQAALYKGACLVELASAANITVHSGDAEVTEGTRGKTLIISGDCEISIT